MLTIKRNRSGVLTYALTEQPKSSPVEEIEQINLIQLIRFNLPEVAKLTWHTVNEGKIKPQYRLKLERQGLLSGVADNLCLYHGESHPVWACELKRARNSQSSISKEQTQFLLESERQGHFSCVAYGAYAGWHSLLDYLGVVDDTMRSKANHLLR